MVTIATEEMKMRKEASPLGIVSIMSKASGYVDHMLLNDDFVSY